MTYNSAGAQLLQQYTATHPENIVWDEEKGWHNDGTA